MYIFIPLTPTGALAANNSLLSSYSIDIITASVKCLQVIRGLPTVFPAWVYGLQGNTCLAMLLFSGSSTCAIAIYDLGF